MRQKLDLITVRTFQNYFTAQITCTKLQSAGIVCYLSDSSTATVAPFLSTAIGGIKLVVRKEDEEEVNTLLNQIDEEYRKNAVCPKCGNHTIELITKPTPGNMFTVVLSWFVGDFAMSKKIYQCSTCKYESEALPESFHVEMDYQEEQLN